MKERTYKKRNRMEAQSCGFVCCSCGTNYHIERRIDSANRRKIERIMRRNKRRRMAKSNGHWPKANEYREMFDYVTFDINLAESLRLRMIARDYSAGWAGLVKIPSTNLKITAI